MRKTRRWNIRKETTWMMTDSVSSTKRPPMMGSRRTVLVMSARPASAVPMASEPVSPMMIRAGWAFHHRNPMQAPTIAAATTARSSAWATS